MIRHGVAFSPDGKHLASGSGDESLYVRNVEGDSLSTKPFIFIGHTGGVYSVTYSPDGRRIDSGSADKTVVVGTLPMVTHFLPLMYILVMSTLTLTPTMGYMLSRDTMIKRYEFKTFQTGLAAHIPSTDHAVRIDSVCFSSDGNWIISGIRDKTVCVWNASTGVLFFQSRVSSKVNCVASFPSSDNKHIKYSSSFEDGAIYFWSVDVESEGEEWRLEDNGWLTGRNKKLLIWISPRSPSLTRTWATHSEFTLFNHL